MTYLLATIGIDTGAADWTGAITVGPGLHQRHARMLAYLDDYWARHRTWPSLTLMAAALNINRTTAFRHLRTLQDCGYVRRVIDSQNALQLLPVPVAKMTGRPPDSPTSVST